MKFRGFSACGRGALAVLLAGASWAQTPAASAPQRKLLDQYCVTCHNQRLKTANLTLDTLDLDHIADGAEIWEKVVRKIHGGTCRRRGMPRPDAATLRGLAGWLETSLDKAAATNINPGRTALHRLNRTEYANTIRDLLALDIDAKALLPADDESNGFDNIAEVLKVSPSCLNNMWRRRARSAAWPWAIRRRSPVARFIRFRRILRRKSTSRACRWAHAAEFWCTIISRSTPNMTSASPCCGTSSATSPGWSTASIEITMDGERVFAHRSVATKITGCPTQIWASPEETLDARLQSPHSREGRPARRRGHVPAQRDSGANPTSLCSRSRATWISRT